MVMKVIQNITDLNTPFNYSFFWKKFFLKESIVKDVFQGFTFYIIHNKIITAFFHKMVLHHRQAVMSEFCQHNCFFFKFFYGIFPFFRFFEIITHCFNNTWHILKIKIFCQINLGHTSAAYGIYNFISAMIKNGSFFKPRGFVMTAKLTECTVFINFFSATATDTHRKNLTFQLFYFRPFSLKKGAYCLSEPFI